jgi:hypothetical protein
MDFQKSTPICNSEDRNKPTPNLTARPTRLCTQTGHRLNRHAGPAAHLGPSVIEKEREQDRSSPFLLRWDTGSRGGGRARTSGRQGWAPVAGRGSTAPLG